MKRWSAMTLAAIAAAGAVAGAWWLASEPRREPPRPSVRPAADLAAARATHERLLAQAATIAVSALMPLPQAADDSGVPSERIALPAPPPPAQDSRRIALFLTGNAAGELEPCG